MPLPAHQQPTPPRRPRRQLASVRRLDRRVGGSDDLTEGTLGSPAARMCRCAGRSRLRRSAGGRAQRGYPKDRAGSHSRSSRRLGRSPRRSPAQELVDFLAGHDGHHRRRADRPTAEQAAVCRPGWRSVGAERLVLGTASIGREDIVERSDRDIAPFDRAGETDDFPRPGRRATRSAAVSSGHRVAGQVVKCWTSIDGRTDRRTPVHGDSFATAGSGTIGMTPDLTSCAIRRRPVAI